MCRSMPMPCMMSRVSACMYEAICAHAYVHRLNNMQDKAGHDYSGTPLKRTPGYFLSVKLKGLGAQVRECARM